jgi:glycerol-3-phosphate acyltransferase PlsY
MIIYYLVCALMSYLVGTINPSYLISRLKHFDIRDAGSKNAGGTNALMAMGGKIGAFCMIFDVLKAFFIVKMSMNLMPDPAIGMAVSSTFVILGHIFPFYMNFKGGKGLACLGGSLLAYSFTVAMIFLFVEIVIVLIVNYMVVVPISGSIAYPIVYYLRGGPVIGTAILFLSTAAILYKHRENLKRIRAGREVHFSYLWKKEKELERVKNNMGDEEYDKLQVKKNVKR